jgi:hypothetical protein
MNALVPVQAIAAPVSHVGRAGIAQCTADAFETAELFTAHNTEREQVALIHDPALPWVVRRGGPLPTIVGRYQTQAEADCAALGANHAHELTRSGSPPGPA